MARMKFLCDADRCIECNACVTSCKNAHEVPWGINRRRVVTIQDGLPGERSVSMACMHCTDAPCAQVCPVNCFYTTNDGVVLHNKDTCIGCGYCFYACPFGAPSFGANGKMQKCDGCVTRVACGMLPSCVQHCPTGALRVVTEEDLKDDRIKKSLHRMSETFFAD